MTQALIVSTPQSLALCELPQADGGAFTVDQIFRWYQEKEYPRFVKDERCCINTATRDLLILFGDQPAREFGPLKLRFVREAMIRRGWTRRFINQSVARLRAVFRFAASWEMIPASVPDSLDSLRPLRAGESSARDNPPRHAVPEADRNAVRGVLSELHQDIFDLLLLTGARPGELLGLTTGQVDQSAEVWRVDFVTHKTSRKGKSRFLLFNPEAQAILRKYLQDDPDALLFNVKRLRFGRIVKAACIKTGVKPFTPHWLRHTVACRVVDDVGLEAAQQLLGHCSAAMTHHYSRSATKQAMKAVGVLNRDSVDVKGQDVPITEKLAWSTADVQAVTSMAATTIRQLVAVGKLPCLMVEGRPLFNPEDVRRFILETSEEARQKVERVRRPNPPTRRPWTEDEERLLLRMSVAEVAAKTGRGIKAVRFRLKWLKMIGVVK